MKLLTFLFLSIAAAAALLGSSVLADEVKCFEKDLILKTNLNFQCS